MGFQPCLVNVVVAGFESNVMTASEPESASDTSTVDIPVIRTGGSRGVIAVKWEAKYKGNAAISCHHNVIP